VIPIQNISETNKIDDFGKHDTPYLIEILGWIIFGIIATIFDILQTIFIFGAIGYLFIERRKRNRPKSVLGFRRGYYKEDIKSNWWLVLLVGVVSQILSVFAMYWFKPDTIIHIIARIPILGDGTVDIIGLSTLYIMLVFSTLGEELVFRVLLQNRLSWYIRPLFANLVISILFGIAHFQAGDFTVILFDIIPIIIDSMLYGWIWQRSHNVLIAWKAHWLADWVGLSLLLLFL
jgi:membrane protease YdiL (CAAX protease family)